MRRNVAATLGFGFDLFDFGFKIFDLAFKSGGLSRVVRLIACSFQKYLKLLDFVTSCLDLLLLFLIETHECQPIELVEASNRALVPGEVKIAGSRNSFTIDAQ